MAEKDAIVVPSAALPVYCFSFLKFIFLMGLLEILILISGLSFLAYGLAYFTSSHMKSEFIRFGLGKFGILTALLEILGALGLFVGIQISSILLISSGGLAVLMLFGFLIRLKVKDSFWVSFPAFIFMVLNAFIFFMEISK